MNDSSRLFASLKFLGLNPKMKTFPERKKVQKVVYLLDKVFDLDFNYSYNWYLHGPYSPELTKIIFDVVERDCIVNSDPSTLSDEDKIKIRRLKTFLKDDLESNDVLELLVSLHYLMNCKDETKS